MSVGKKPAKQDIFSESASSN